MNVLTNKSFVDNIDCIVSLIEVFKQNKLEFDNSKLFDYIKCNINKNNVCDVEYCISLIKNFFYSNCITNNKLNYLFKNISENIYQLFELTHVDIFSYNYTHNYITLNKLINS